MPSIRDEGGGFDLWFETHGERRNDPVFLLHGFTGNHSTWSGLCSSLMDNHFMVVPDLPGHGRSGTSSIERMNMDSTSESLLKLLDHLRIARTAMLGYSMGGRIALNFAVKHQDRLACLVLESASAGIQDRREREERKSHDDTLAGDIEKYGLDWFVERWENMPLLSTQKTLDPSVIQTIRKERLLNTVNGLSMSLRAVGIGNMDPLWERLDGLEVPVLLVVGEKDEKFLTIGEAMKERLSSCALEVVKGAGHCVHAERPETFRRIVGQFLDEHSGEKRR